MAPRSAAKRSRHQWESNSPRPQLTSHCATLTLDEIGLVFRAQRERPVLVLAIVDDIPEHFRVGPKAFRCLLCHAEIVADERLRPVRHETSTKL